MKRFRFEELEERRLLSGDVLNALSEYVGFVGDFSTLNNKEVVLISGKDLNYDVFDAVIREAARSPKDDVIAVEGGFMLTFGLNDKAFELNDLNGSITIIGLGGDFVIDASGVDRIFSIGSGSVVNLGSTILRGGYCDYGAGIRNAGTLTIERVTISDCRAVNGGAVENSGEFYFQDSTICGNFASKAGAAIYVGNSETAVCVGSNSIIARNASGNAGTVYVAEKCVFRSYNCTIVANSAATSALFAERGETSETNGKIIAGNSIILGNVDAENRKLPALNVGSGRANLTDLTKSWANNFVYRSTLPLFVDYDANDFRLAADSQALDLGAENYAVDVYGRELRRDYSGAARPFGSGVDVGAFEYGSAPRQETPTINVAVNRFNDSILLLNFTLSSPASRLVVYWGDVSDGTIIEEFSTSFIVAHYYDAPGDFSVFVSVDKRPKEELTSFYISPDVFSVCEESTTPAPIRVAETAAPIFWTPERRKVFATVWEEFESFEFDL